MAPGITVGIMVGTSSQVVANVGMVNLHAEKNSGVLLHYVVDSQSLNKTNEHFSIQGIGVGETSTWILV